MRPTRLADLETDRLLLRAPTDADLDAVFAVFSDPATQRHNPAGPMESREAAGHLLWRWQLHWAQHGFGMWVVCRREAPEQVLGFGGLSWRDYAGEQRLNLGFRLRPAAWGRGLATELGQAALALAFGELGQDEVCALVRPDNLASRRVLEKLGLRGVGELSDFPWLPASLVYRLGLDCQAGHHLASAPLHARADAGLRTAGRPERARGKVMQAA